MVEQAFQNRAEIRTIQSVREATDFIAQHRWSPDIVVVANDVEDARQPLTVSRLREAVEPTPVIMGAKGIVPLIEARFWSGSGLGPGERRRPGAARVSLEAIFEEQQALAQTISTQRLQLGAEIERAATQAAEAAVTRAVEQLVNRLGLEDAEGLRLAIRFARAWEAAKVKFFSAVTTGLASAFLLAVGAGIISMLRHTDTK